jgi:hypothetical protein
MKAIAFVIDGEVVEVVNYDDRMASIMLSNPTIVDISNHNITAGGWTFDGTAFSTVIDGQQVVVPVQGQ